MDIPFNLAALLPPDMLVANGVPGMAPAIDPALPKPTQTGASTLVFSQILAAVTPAGAGMARPDPLPGSLASLLQPGTMALPQAGKSLPPELPPELPFAANGTGIAISVPLAPDNVPSEERNDDSAMATEPSLTIQPIAVSPTVDVAVVRTGDPAPSLVAPVTPSVVTPSVVTPSVVTPSPIPRPGASASASLEAPPPAPAPAAGQAPAADAPVRDAVRVPVIVPKTDLPSMPAETAVAVVQASQMVPAPSGQPVATPQTPPPQQTPAPLSQTQVPPETLPQTRSPEFRLAASNRDRAALAPEAAVTEASVAPRVAAAASDLPAAQSSMSAPPSSSLTPLQPHILPEPRAAAGAAVHSPSAGPPSTAPAPETPYDFAGLVDRLAAARDAAAPVTRMLEPVRTAIVHREFGEVSLAIEPVDGGLLVAMKSADPGFVPAVQAASAPGDAGTTRSDAGAGGGAASATGSNGGQSGQQRAPDRHATPDGQRLPPGGQNRPKRDARDIYA